VAQTVSHIHQQEAVEQWHFVAARSDYQMRRDLAMSDAASSTRRGDAGAPRRAALPIPPVTPAERWTAVSMTQI
jgi:hypothetical protein